MTTMAVLLPLLTLLWGTAGSNFLPTIARLSLLSCNDVTLICQVQTVQGFQVRVENARFLANDTNIQDFLTGTEIDDSVEGEISFTLRQQLEAFYKCGNGSSSYISRNSIPLTSCPTRTEVDRYHAVPVGQQVSLECGIRQGKLGSHYHPEWHKGIETLDTTSPDSLYRLQREELEDFTLTFLNPSLSDSGMYSCDVKVEQDNGMVPVEDGGKIQLIVYERPIITFMTEDTTAIINNGESKNITFVCNATGSPDLMVLWYHNGERVASNKKYSIDETPTEGAVSSRLTMSDPKLTDSGIMMCKAKVSFRTDAGNDNRSTETLSTETARNILILDNSPSVRVTVTQDSDLLVRISLGDAVLLQPVKLYLNYTSRETGETVSDRPDSKYSGVSVIYHFIPASQIPNGYRRFWLQVALVVGDEVGPYNPPVLTSSLITDLDEQTNGGDGVWSNAVIIGVAVAAACVLVVCIIACSVTCICINRHNKKKEEHHDDNRHQARVDKFTKVQETTRYLCRLLLTANEAQAACIRKELDSLRENAGRLADDGAEDGGTVTDDSGEEADKQRALRDYIEKLNELAQSEQFTRKLDEICGKVSSPNHTTRTTGIVGNGGSGGRGNGQEESRM